MKFKRLYPNICLARVDVCQGTLKRAYLNPANHLYHYPPFRMFFYPSKGLGMDPKGSAYQKEEIL
ncbi:MAG: hypothetical protein HOA12_00870 [Candidatus Marinimicrobia bacterium]|jgi:hypothetical protein|nr:hypothetical protein [Candidatus Neomarinimicrobiota bacterium]